MQLIPKTGSALSVLKIRLVRRTMSVHSHFSLTQLKILSFRCDICIVNDSIHTVLALAAMLTLQSEWVMYPF